MELPKAITAGRLNIPLDKSFEGIASHSKSFINKNEIPIFGT
jgi:hypothetical protein